MPLTTLGYLQEKLPEGKIIWTREEYEPRDWTILNINNNSNVDGHWVLIYKDFYCDPYGFPPCDLIIDRMLKYYKKIKINTYKIQYINSDNCGNICIYVADLIKKGHTPKEIIESQR